MGGKILKYLLNTFLDIDENGNLSTGDFLFNLACLCLSIFTGGASLLAKLKNFTTLLKQLSKLYHF